MDREIEKDRERRIIEGKREREGDERDEKKSGREIEGQSFRF